MILKNTDKYENDKNAEIFVKVATFSNFWKHLKTFLAKFMVLKQNVYLESIFRIQNVYVRTKFNI